MWDNFSSLGKGGSGGELPMAQNPRGGGEGADLNFARKSCRVQAFFGRAEFFDTMVFLLLPTVFFGGLDFSFGYPGGGSGGRFYFA